VPGGGGFADSAFLVGNGDGEGFAGLGGHCVRSP
jgi:hypothetical protein